MSLLMDALKKAEQAKKGTSPASTETPAGLSLEPIAGTQPPPATPPEFPALSPEKLDTPEPPPELRLEPAPASVETKTEAPPSIEIDLGATPQPPVTAEPPPPPAEPKAEVPPPAKPVSAPAPASPPPPPPAASAQDKAKPEDSKPLQQTAKAVFAAKRPPKSSRALLLTMLGALIIAVGGTSAYLYWHHLSARSTKLVTVPPPAPQAVPPMAAAPAAPSPAPTEEPPTKEEEAEEAIPVAPPKPAARQEARKEAVASASETPIMVRRGSTQPAINPLLSSAYEDFQRGDTTAAEGKYRQVLKTDPSNRDAMQGLAAALVQRRQMGEAAALYQRLLELDPRDSLAQAALASIQHQTDPVAVESRLKNQLARDPQSAFLHYSLGNFYAGQSRWNEAQQAYFNAFATDPANPDYAFNLAVSLEHLEQSSAALEHYQRALSLATQRQAAFDKSAVSRRIQEIKGKP